ncbi:MAG: aspartate-semialdehyde dehydrogenase [Halobacteriovoraceae bacterium]|nr:aspartate-semialdehyde dehydrogenase [Halobacteriovoraceae bacterium]
MEKISIAVLGATGTVGQKLLAMLENHPLFQVTQLVASDKNIGKRYVDACDWRETAQMPTIYQNMMLESYEDITAKYAVSSLPSDIAKIAEPYLAQKGIHVVSNASTFRMDKNTPLIIPEINPSHLELIGNQKTPGKIITNPNCATVFLTLALRPLLDLGKINFLSVVTLQALSGAGYPGVSSMDILGNIIPYIGNEEDKIETEALKILGTPNECIDLKIITHVNRVPVLHGHTVAMHVVFEEEVKEEKVIEKFSELQEKFPELYKLYLDPFRPQPLKDITQYDQRAHVGRIKQGPDLKTIGLISMGHNLVRGAAGAAILNLELLHNHLTETNS